MAEVEALPSGWEWIQGYNSSCLPADRWSAYNRERDICVLITGPGNIRIRGQAAPKSVIDAVWRRWVDKPLEDG